MFTFGWNSSSYGNKIQLSGGYFNIRISPARVYGMQICTAEVDVELAGVVVRLHKGDPDEQIPCLVAIVAV